MKWLINFAEAAQKTDHLADRPNHHELLKAGLMGEAGSILAELKKEKRERDSYPVYRHRMTQEVGDFLWYFVRLVSVTDPALLTEFRVSQPRSRVDYEKTIGPFLQFGGAVGDLLMISSTTEISAYRLQFLKIWTVLNDICGHARLDLESVATSNLSKIHSRWPVERKYAPLFDDDCDEEDQLPRHLNIEFRERHNKVVILRCNKINFGDRITDNIQDKDQYRYHDIFHFSYAVHLGWSPVMRDLLRAKRKGKGNLDEEQDGARAAIIEEAVSAIVFSRAKRLNFFDGLQRVDYDLLKTIAEFVEGYEVSRIPLWQWEVAILEGFRIFRTLRDNHGGRVILDLIEHRLDYFAPEPARVN